MHSNQSMQKSTVNSLGHVRKVSQSNYTFPGQAFSISGKPA